MKGFPRRTVIKMRRAAARLHLEYLTINHDGHARDCLFFAPTGVATKKPLLLALHPGASSPLGMAQLTRFQEIAAREDFIIAFPGGAGPWPRSRTWNAGGDINGWAERNNIDDIGFLRALIGMLRHRLPVDDDRVYVAGMSKGAMMAYYLAARTPHEIAAVAAVAGPLCDSALAVPTDVSLLHIHGLRDENVPFEGGAGARTRGGSIWPSSHETVAQWRRANGIAGESSEGASSAGVSRYADRSADAGAAVELILIEKGGHVWPGARLRPLQRLLGAKPSDAINASEEIWRFFKDKRRAPKQR